MRDTAIRVEGLGKQYHIGRQHESFPSLVANLRHLLQTPARRFRSVMRGQLPQFADETMWALKDVSFEVKEGEVLGIIGSNGAGKSTLLKILTGITDPTEGYAEIRGRVGSLLEVGTGFNAELTGRENVYLNGSILGMKTKEIDAKFDEMVAFSGVEQYIDTPVKRYSSGMKVRLAFAVASHLDPEILLIDEVLSVGDAAFRRKCLTKMAELTGEGRTVLYVSHNMPSVENLCDWAILLQSGQITMTGDPGEVVRYYLRQEHDVSTDASVSLIDHPGRATRTIPTLSRLRLLNAKQEETNVFPIGDSITFEIELDTGDSAYDETVLTILIQDDNDDYICKLKSNHFLSDPLALSGRHLITCAWEDCNLGPNEYTISLGLKQSSGRIDNVANIVKFEMVPGNFFDTMTKNEPKTVIWARGQWRFDQLDHSPELVSLSVQTGLDK